jgi:5-methylcytosine-specific restriction endonuclease McrA
MALYKVNATVSFEYTCDGTSEESLEKARALLERVILEPAKTTGNYSNFNVQIESVPLKEREPKRNAIKEIKPATMFRWMEEGHTRKQVKINGKIYDVKLNSDRYKLFRKNLSCVACGLKGTKFILEIQPQINNQDSAHFNLYAEEEGHLVLMTKDHIVPKSYGGPDKLENLQTYCSTCNQLKGSFPLSNDSVYILRQIFKNKEHLPTKGLRKKIADTRLSMLDCLNGQ